MINAVEIWFADPQTAAVCSCLEQLQERWGPDGGTQVGRRLQQMEAAPTLKALRTLPGRCRPCDAHGENWVIDVAEIATIVFRPDPPASGSRESEMIARAIVISVLDYPIRPGGS